MHAQARQLPRVASTRRRVHVVAETAADVVCGVGGWLFDQTSAGWETTVLLLSGGEIDHRCLRVLGARSAPMMVCADNDIGPVDAVMVAINSPADRLSGHTVLRDALHQGLQEVLLFGGIPQRALGIDFHPERHVLSVAARAFKRHAAIALDVPRAIDDRSERIWRARLPSAAIDNVDCRPMVSSRN
jgi:hypothetical protein